MPDAGHYHVAVRARGKVTWRVICKTWSRPYALRVARKWRKAGYDAFVEAVQQEDSCEDEGGDR